VADLTGFDPEGDREKTDAEPPKGEGRKVKKEG
jgi:hypothetical protein